MLESVTSAGRLETGTLTGASPSGWSFPTDQLPQAPPRALLAAVRRAAARACGNSWLNLLREEDEQQTRNHLLVVVSYCYLQGLFNSAEVIRRLEEDESLREEREHLYATPEEVRRFRRDHRRAVTDCLTHALVALWQQGRARGQGEPSNTREPGIDRQRVSFDFLEPFYLSAQDLVNRAVFLDSNAFDH